MQWRGRQVKHGAFIPSQSRPSPSWHLGGCILFLHGSCRRYRHVSGSLRQLVDVAAIDGAGEWRQFRYVTLPLIRPTTLFVLVMLVIGGFNVFLSVLLITGGAPLHRTDVVLSYMYDRAFNSPSFGFGYGAALSYILAAIVVSINFAQMRLFRRPQVEY